MRRLPSAFAPVLFAALALAACQPSAESDAAPAPSPTPASFPAPQAALPAVALDDARAFVRPGGTLETPTFDAAGSTTATGTVRGDAAPVFAVPLAAGQSATVVFESASPNLYFNVSDAADHSGAALHRGEIDGMTAVVTAPRDMTLVITPFQPRAMARRGEAADFTLTITRR